MKKIIYFITTILIIGIMNVQALTVGVSDNASLISALSNDTVSVVKLEGDFTYSGAAPQDVNNTNNMKTLDLNGYTLSSNVDIQLRSTKYVPYDNFNFTITDSSALKNGKIVSNSTANVISFTVYNLTNIFTVKIDSGIYEATDSSSRFFLFGNGSYETYDPSLDVVLENAKFTGKYRLVSNNKFSYEKINVSLDNIEYSTALFGGGVCLIDWERPFSTLFDSTKNDLYINDALHTNLDGNAGTSTCSTQSFKIRSKAQLSLDPITMLDKEYGYATSDSYDLNIKNNSIASIVLKGITLTNTAAFAVEGDVNLTILEGGSNNDLKIKAKTGLDAGTYSTDVTVTDTNDNVYSLGTITFVVTKATINPTISIANWTFGDIPSEPSVTDNPSNGVKTYYYKDGTGETSTTKPNIPGTYDLTVVIAEGTNHNEFTKTVSFKINKKEITISDLSISDKYYSYSNPSLAVSQVTYTANVANVTYVRLVTPNSESELNVGKWSARVVITIKEGDYSQYYYFAGDNVIEVVEEAAYEILPTNIAFTFTHSGSDDEINTPISINKGASLDLLSLFDLDETSLKNRVTYSLIGTPTGVSIYDKKLVVEGTAATQTVGVQLNFLAYDNDGDGTVEINDRTEYIYIKITDKELVILSGLTNDEVFTYDGSAKNPSGTIVVQYAKVPVSELEVIYNGIDGTTYSSVDAPINAGKYSVTYKVADSNPTYYGSVTYNFTINKANPIYTVPTNIDDGIKNDELNTIPLPIGFSWVDPYIEMTVAGTQTFFVEYTPTDTVNYNIITGISVEVYVKDKFDITTNSLGNGTITPSTTGVLEGETIEVVVTPNTGYVVDELKVNGVKTDATNNILSIKVLEDLTIEVSFKKQQFTIDITGINLYGLNITPSSSTYVDYGTDKDITIEVKDGYKILSIKVNGEDKELKDNKLSLTNITVNYVIEIKVEELKKETVPEETEKPTVILQEPYRVIEGANQEVIAGGKVDAKFKINADYSLFMAVYVNNKLLDPSNYTVENGSTIVILKQSYLETLEEGKYTLKVVFKDSKEVQTGFTVSKENVDSKETKETKEKTEDTKEETTENKFNLWYLIAALVLVGIIIIIFRRKKEEK